MTNTEYQLYSLLVSLFATIGTIGAVIVALYLARLSRKISLLITADLFEFKGSPDGEYVFIQVTNDGYQPVYIKNILFQYGIWKKTNIPVLEQNIYFEQSNFNPPIHKLEVGNMIHLTIKKQFLNDIYKDFLSKSPMKKIFTLNVIVSTTFNKVYKVNISSNIRNYLKEIQNG